MTPNSEGGRKPVEHKAVNPVQSTSASNAVVADSSLLRITLFPLLRHACLAPRAN